MYRSASASEPGAPAGASVVAMPSAGPAASAPGGRVRAASSASGSASGSGGGRYRPPPHRRWIGGGGAGALVSALVAAGLLAHAAAAPPPAPPRPLRLFALPAPAPAAPAPARHAVAAQRIARPSPAAGIAPSPVVTTAAVAPAAAMPVAAAAPTGAVPAPPPPAPAARPAPAPAAAEPPTAPARGDEAAALRARYARQLWQHIAARRPRGLNLPGVARIRFAVDATGQVSGVVIDRSSGTELLDRLALRTVARAAPMPAPPAALGPGLFAIDFSFD